MRRLLTRAEVMERCHLSKRAYYRLRGTDQLPCVFLPGMMHARHRWQEVEALRQYRIEHKLIDFSDVVLRYMEHEETQAAFRRARPHLPKQAS